tara:strand:+ start:2484 stop:2963 length:480 start_codon:yes stop_codon:yes gene_type:complete
MTEVILGLGSNIGDKKQNILTAYDLIAKVGSNAQISPFYETLPQGFAVQPNFVNAVCVVDVNLIPWEFFHYTSLVEKTVGRNKSFLNAPRLIDIDILMWGDQEFITPILTSPHPRMTEREFVLRPLIDLLPKVVHPITKKTVFEMYKDAKGSNGLMRHV